MTNLDRLLTRINAVLDGDAEGFEARALASEYAALAEGVADRLQRCASLVASGNDHAAFRLAETEPPVLDLAAKLAFARAGLWRDHCRAQRLPAPPRIEDRLVDIANGLYSREIGESHPLYRDYRSAVREHDDRRALAVLRSIARINKTDLNARDEYARLSAKVRREYLAKLDDALDSGDTDGVLAIMAATESAGLVPADGDPVWKLAEEIREKTERERALAEALALVPEIAACRDAGDTEGAIPSLGRVRTLEKQYGFIWPEHEGRIVAETERLMAALAAEAEAIRLADERRGELLSRLDALENEAAGARSAETLAGLDSWLADADGSDVPEDDVRRAATLAGKLRKEIASSKMRVRISLTALFLVAAAGAGFGAMKVVDYRNRHLFAEELAKAEKNDDPGTVTGFLDDALKRFPELAVSPENKSRIDALIARSKTVAESMGRISDEAGALRRDADGGEKSVSALRERLASLLAATGALPEGPRQRLTPALNAIAATIDARAIAEPASVIEKSLPKDGEAFTPASGFVSAVVALDAALKSPGAAPAEVLARGTAALKAAREHVSEAETAAATEAASKSANDGIAAAGTTEDYLKAVSALAAVSPTAPECIAAGKIAAAADTIRKLPGALLPPAMAAMCDALAAGATPPFLPADATASESANAAPFAALAKFAGVRRAMRETYPETGGVIATPVLLAGDPKTEQFELNGGTETRMKASVLRAGGPPEEVDARVIRFDGRAPRGETFTGIADAPEGPLLESVAKSFDASKGAFTEPPLALLDRVLASEAPPLLKAWIHRQIAEIVAERPGSMGATFVPAFAEDLKKLASLMPAPLPRDAWLSPAKYGALAGRLSTFYAEKRGPYAPVAATNATLVGKVISGGVTFAGYVKADGTPVVRDDTPPGCLLYGIDDAGNAAPVAVTGEAPKDALKKPAPFSPLLRWTVSPEKAAAEASSPFAPKS